MVDHQANHQRNYAAGEIGKLMVQHLMMEDNEDYLGGKHAMTVEEVEKVAVRDKEFLETERGMKCLVFYHDNLLPKAACSEHWSENVRTRHTISGARHQKTYLQGERDRITEGLEAFVCANFKGNYERWKKIAKGKKEKGTKWTPSPKLKEYWGEFTKPSEGLAGYTIPGRLYFGKMRKEIAEGRKQAHVYDAEVTALGHVQ
jgi:hypothetical protein